MDRRRFVEKAAAGAAGLLVAGGTGASAAEAGVQAGAAPRRQAATLGGRRARTVDFHAHCVVPGIREMLGETTPPDSPLLIGPRRLEAMDSQGIDLEILSINPFWYRADRDLARKLITTQNEKLAQLCAAHPGRFAALATVALQHPDLAAEQLQQAMKAFGLGGASVGGSVEGEELASPRFDPFWAKAEELGAAIFIHPQGVPALQSRLKGNGVLGNVIGNPLETTIALSHLIFEGTLDRFPGLKICAAHGGGYLPSYADRSDHGCLTFPEQCTKTLKKRPTEYLKQIYVDSLVFSGGALQRLVEVCGASQIVLGTDHPFPWTSTAVEHVLGTPGLSAEDRRAILGGNAARLLNLAP